MRICRRERPRLRVGCAAPEGRAREGDCENVATRWAVAHGRTRRRSGLPFRLPPLAPAVHASKGVNGLENGFGRHGNAVGALDYVPEREAQLAIANFVEIEGMRVAIDGTLGNSIIVGDIERIVPVEEFFFDGVALLVAADATAGFMGK